MIILINDNELEELKPKPLENPIVRMAILGFAIVLFGFGLFYIGAYAACSQGGGDLVGFQCKNVEVIGACEYQEKLYIPPNDSALVWEVVP